MSDEFDRHFAALRASLEAQLVTALVGEPEMGSAISSSAGPLDLDLLKRLSIEVAQRFPKETWLQSIWFPADRAIRFEASGENFLLAGEPFWRQCHAAMSRLAERSTNSLNPLLGFDPTPQDIDLRDTDDDDQRERKRAIWARVADTLQVAMIPLPDWLRAERR